MPWYNNQPLTIGQFMAWLQNSESARDKSKLVTMYLGISYLLGNVKPGGNGSYQSLSGHPLTANSANELMALTAEIAVSAFGGGQDPAETTGRLPLTRAMVVTIMNMGLPDPGAPDGFVQGNRDANNFLKAAKKAANNGYHIIRRDNAIKNELRDFLPIADPIIQGWFDTWDTMRTEQANVPAQKALGSLRAHQKMKFLGEKGIFVDKGGHGGGNFWLLTRAIDGHAVILISSKQEKDIKAKYTQVATGNSSVVGREISGTFVGDKKTKRYLFSITGGRRTDVIWFQSLPENKQKN